MGALVTLELSEDSPLSSMPWIITFGPLDDEEEWEPVVCGPYERPHALSLAESIVADEDLMAVVEPVLPHASVAEIRNEIEAARMVAEEEDAEVEEYLATDLDTELAIEVEEEYEEYVEDETEETEVAPPPSPEEVRAGFARIAAKLTGGALNP